MDSVEAGTGDEFFLSQVARCLRWLWTCGWFCTAENTLCQRHATVN